MKVGNGRGQLLSNVIVVEILSDFIDLLGVKGQSVDILGVKVIGCWK